MKNLQCGCAAHAVLERHVLCAALDSLRCPACERVLLSLDDYRVWRSRHGDKGVAELHAGVVEDSRQARVCPSCGRLMARPRSGTQPDFHIDHCSDCQLVWLDPGEWARLQAAGLALQLDLVLSVRWQQQLREAEARQRRDADLRLRYGAATMDELARIRAWLSSQPHRAELLALLGSPE